MNTISQISVKSEIYELEDANAIPLSQKGSANGVASLSNNGKIIEQQLPYTMSIVEL